VVYLPDGKPFLPRARATVPEKPAVSSGPAQDVLAAQAAKRDRLLRAVVIGVLPTLAAWFITRWMSGVNPVDFLVYRYGSAMALHGTDIYARNISGPRIALGGMPYTYSPFALLALLPTVLGSWRVTYRIWCLAALLAVALTENVLVVRLIPLRSGRRRAVVLAAALALTAFSTMMVNEISFGQINSLLMLACLADLFRPRHGRWARLIPPGTLVGVATAIKLTPGLFICYFVVTRQWRLARNSGLAAAVCLLAAAVVYPTMSEQFFTSVLWHLPSRVAFEGGFATSGNQSVQGMLAAVGAWTAPLRAPASVAAAALGLWAARTCHRLGREPEAWLITGITAELVSPVSWIHHWIWLAPAILLCATRARSLRQRAAVAGAIMMLLLSPNAGDYLIRHGPAWALPVAVVQRECLVVVGIWCCLTFVIYASRNACPEAPATASNPGRCESRPRSWSYGTMHRALFVVGQRVGAPSAMEAVAPDRGAVGGAQAGHPGQAREGVDVRHGQRLKRPAGSVPVLGHPRVGGASADGGA
jgi:alpha-1,2-mannosyltransferase